MNIINLDYDETFTTNPIFWSNFVRLANKAGYKVICISQRTDNENNWNELTKALPKSVEIFFTNHNGKKEWAEKRDINVNIWIENDPLALIQSDCPLKQKEDNYGKEESITAN